MPETPHLALPLLAAAQAQKHVTHNEALAVLDALVHLAVEEVRTDPPAAPDKGSRYLVGEGATGAFAGQDRSIAFLDLGAWRFLTPQAGWRAYVSGQGRFLIHDGSGWRDLGTVIGTLANLDRLGVGTSADATNRITAKLNAALFTALGQGEGGSGDLRLVLNKAGAGNVVSQLYQSAFGGRAETGLIGNDDFTLKVSPNDGTWREALRVSAATGVVSFPSGAAGLSGAGGRNLLINDGFTVNQRVFAGGALAAGAYGYDRWKAGPGGCSLAVAADGTATLTGTLVQVIEAPRLAGLPVTVSVDGPTGPVIVDVAGASGTIAAGPGRRSVTLQVPGAATGNVALSLAGEGVSFARPALVPGVDAATAEPLPFPLMLALCQRYYEKSYDLAVAPGTSSNAGLRTGRIVTTGQVTIDALSSPFSVRKRALPTVTWFTPAGLSGRLRNLSTSTDVAVSATNLTGETSTGVPVIATAPGVGSLLQAHWTADAEL